MNEISFPKIAQTTYYQNMFIFMRLIHVEKNSGFLHSA